MTEPTARQRLILDETSKPKLHRYINMRRDETRNRWTLLAPERVMTPDDIAVQVLQKCDGEKTIQDISEALAKEFNAPVETIMADVIEMLQDLADKGYLTA